VIRQVAVSPSGDWVVARAAHSDRWGVIAQRRGQANPVLVYSSPERIEDVQWLGPNTLLARHPQKQWTGVVLRLAWEHGAMVWDELRVGRPGSVVDPLPDLDETVLWAQDGVARSRVIRGPIEAIARGATWKISGERARGAVEEVARIDGLVERWVTDRNGEVRAALKVEGPPDWETTLLYRNVGASRWLELARWDEPTEAIVPLGFSEDGSRLVVATYADGDNFGLHEYDPGSRSVTRTIFVQPGRDLTGAIFDYGGSEIIAATYEVAGETHYHYFDDFRDRHLKKIEGIPDGQTAHLTGSSSDHRFFSLLVSGAANPGSFFFFEKESGRLSRLGDVIPDVPADALVEMRAFDVESADGTPIEAFLAVPRSGGGRPPPLLVLPHGGPISVRDTRSFDPFVQLIALDGIAVLKVNYRGSYGYGRAFLESGKKEWAEGIEADVDAAVDLVIEKRLVDSERICIAGFSYGGYSAMISAIRRPDRYRCAVSLNGPMDLPLLFLSSDFARVAKGRERMAELLGDPESDFDHLVEISPVYQAENLRVPVLLAHGAFDERVDPDHAYRMRSMLDLYEIPYEWLVLSESGHSPSNEEFLKFSLAARAFLRTHLVAATAPPR
jgi:dipeptidyl aminopeptidase/acylaminoacyl peptidase